MAWRKLASQRGDAMTPSGRKAKFVVLGLGKLGGCELNYSSDIDLVFLYDHDGKTNGPRSTTNHEFFDALAREIVRLLTGKYASGHGVSGVICDCGLTVKKGP